MPKRSQQRENYTLYTKDEDLQDLLHSLRRTWDVTKGQMILRLVISGLQSEAGRETLKTPSDNLPGDHPWTQYTQGQSDE